MKPTPAGWPRISPAIYYEDASTAIEWLCRAFGFEVRMAIRSDDGRIEHSELTFGDDGLIMVGETLGKIDKYPQRRAPSAIGGINTQNLMLYVDDVEEHFARARAAGAIMHKEPTTTDYGEDYWSDRGYECEDVGGHRWWFYQRLR